MPTNPESSVEFLPDDLVVDISGAQTAPPPADVAPRPPPAARAQPLKMAKVINPTLLSSDRVSRAATPLALPSQLQQFQELSQPVEMSQPISSGPFDWINQRTGVVGVVASPTDGEPVVRGAATATFAEQMNYFRQVAQVIGLELGFENLRELHVGSRDARHLSVQLDDASCVHVISSGLGNTYELAKLIRERQQ
jgi:hypothetical protein